MHATVLEPVPWRERLVLIAAVVASGLVHAAVAGGASHIEPRIVEEPVWVEMTLAVAEPPAPAPEPAPEPEPEPEPPKPVPKEPEVVQYEPEVEEPPPVAPDPKPVPRVVQGLSNESFVKGAGTGLSVRAGTTTSAKATSDVMDLDEATGFATVPYAAVTVPPKARYTPALEVPEVIVADRIEGRVEVVMTIGADGTVTAIEVVGSLHPAADAACVATMKRSRWKPGTKDDAPVVVQGVPYSCRFQMTPG